LSKPPNISQSQSEVIGIIGLGLMGSALASRLLQGGFGITGWDIDSSRCAVLSQIGGKAAVDAAEVVKSCPRVLLSLPDHKVVTDVVRGASASLRRGQMIIDTSTGDPEQAMELGRELDGQGVCYLDATVSGSSAQVGTGEVTVMVGGPKEVFEQCQDLFRCFARRTFHIGPWGSGVRMKLVTNLILGLNRATLAEGLAFAKALDLDPTQTLTVLRESPAYSRVLDSKGPKMAAGSFEPEARLSQHLKDVRLMLAAASRAGLTLPLSETHRRLLELAEAAGLGQLDNSAIIRVFDKMKYET
jgi:3-hydroxyisobutyrate dehydrogenase-like beta-hydroxyacid dehydrogenase